MKFILLIHEPEAQYEGEAGASRLQAITAEHQALAGALAAEGVLRGGAGLASSHTARTLRVSRGRKMLHDGPFAETREQLGGYYIVEVDDMEAAVAVANRIPLASDGAVEVRLLVE